MVCLSASSWPSRVFPHDGDDRDGDDDSDVHDGGGDGCVDGENDDDDE